MHKRNTWVSTEQGVPEGFAGGNVDREIPVITYPIRT